MAGGVTRWKCNPVGYTKSRLQKKKDKRAEARKQREETLQLSDDQKLKRQNRKDYYAAHKKREAAHQRPSLQSWQSWLPPPPQPSLPPQPPFPPPQPQPSPLCQPPPLQPIDADASCIEHFPAGELDPLEGFEDCFWSDVDDMSNEPDGSLPGAPGDDDFDTDAESGEMMRLLRESQDRAAQHAATFDGLDGLDGLGGLGGLDGLGGLGGLGGSHPGAIDDDSDTDAESGGMMRLPRADTFDELDGIDANDVDEYDNETAAVLAATQCQAVAQAMQVMQEAQPKAPKASKVPKRKGSKEREWFSINVSLAPPQQGDYKLEQSIRSTQICLEKCKADMARCKRAMTTLEGRHDDATDSVQKTKLAKALAEWSANYEVARNAFVRMTKRLENGTTATINCNVRFECVGAKRARE